LSTGAAWGGAAATATALADDGDAGSKQPAELITAAQAALGKVQSIHFSASETDKGDATTKIVGSATASGDADYTITAGALQAHLIALPKTVYIKGNSAYWKGLGGKKSGSKLASAFAGKWIKQPAKSVDAGEDLASLTPKRLATCLDSHVGTLTNKGVKTVGGREVVVLADAGDKPGTAPGELWLDTKTSLPVREVQTGPAKAGGKKDSACDDDFPSKTQKSDIALSLFGKAPKIVAPKHAVSPKQAAADDDGGSGTPV
jgi:hypothetical protein